VAAIAIGLSTKIGTSGILGAAQLVQEQQQRLGAADREGRDDDVPPRAAVRRMRSASASAGSSPSCCAAAVGRLHHHDVRVRARLGRGHHDVLLAAEVAGEQHRRRAVVDAQAGRAEDVARAREAAGQAAGRSKRLAEVDGAQQLERGLGVVLGVERARPGDAC
jgi:hypothetical protein